MLQVGDSYQILQNDKVDKDGKPVDTGSFSFNGNSGESDKATFKGNKPDGFKNGLNNIDTYQDPVTGKFYLIGNGEKDGEQSAAEGTNPSAAGMEIPDKWNCGNGKENETFYCKDGGLKDRTWLLEFNSDSSQSI